MISKTVANLTPSEFLRFRNKLKTRQFSLEKPVQQRLDKARLAANRAAVLLKTEFSVSRVVLFGSIATEELFHNRSDIDLAVWDIDPGSYYRAVGMLQAIDPEFSVDLIIFDEASTDLQKEILIGGIEL